MEGMPGRRLPPSLRPQRGCRAVAVAVTVAMAVAVLSGPRGCSIGS